VIFVEHRDVLRQHVGEGALQLVIACFLPDQLVPEKNPVGVGIDDKDRMAASVKQD